MFANKEEVKAWLHANEEYIRYNDPTPGVEDRTARRILQNAETEEQAISIMQSYLLPF